MKSIILKNHPISETVYQLSVECPEIHYIPGSVFSLGVDDVHRLYSTASGVNDTHLTFYYKLVHKGLLTSILPTLKIGDEIEVELASDYFLYPLYHKLLKSEPVFIGTGTGITPYLSWFRYNQDPIKCFFGAQYEKDLPEFERVSSRPTTKIYLSKQESSPYENVHTKSRIKLTDIPLGDYHYFICGLDQMIRDVQGYLTDNGVPYTNIRTETYY